MNRKKGMSMRSRLHGTKHLGDRHRHHRRRRSYCNAQAHLRGCFGLPT